MNGCVLVCYPKQSNITLRFTVKIQSANRMVLSIKYAFVRNIFFRSVTVSVIVISNREPFSYIFTGFCHGAFIHNNIIHQYRIGGFVSISSIDIFHEPVEVTSICNLIYAFHQFRFFVGITDCAEAVFVKVMLYRKRNISRITCFISSRCIIFRHYNYWHGDLNIIISYSSRSCPKLCFVCIVISKRCLAIALPRKVFSFHSG